MKAPVRSVGLFTVLNRVRKLGDAAALALFREWRMRRKLGRELTSREAATWLHETCAGGIVHAEVEIRTSGIPPEHGLVISNHLSYLDVIVLAAAAPMIFIAKKEIHDWFLFGKMAQRSGTLFLDRSRKADLLRMQPAMHRLLGEKVPVCLFPEGGTGNGRELQKFRSPLLQPVAGTKIPVTCAAVRYAYTDGSNATDLVAWTDGQSFTANASRILHSPGIIATAAFGEPTFCPPDRRAAAAKFQSEVDRLRQARGIDKSPPAMNNRSQ